MIDRAVSRRSLLALYATGAFGLIGCTPLADTPAGPAFCGTWHSGAWPWPQYAEDSDSVIYAYTLNILPNGAFEHEFIDVYRMLEGNSTWGDESILDKYTEKIIGSWTSVDDTTVVFSFEGSQDGSSSAESIEMRFDAEHNCLFEDLNEAIFYETQHPILSGEGFQEGTKECDMYTTWHIKHILFSHLEGVYQNSSGDELVLDEDGNARLTRSDGSLTSGSWIDEGNRGGGKQYLVFRSPFEGEKFYQLSVFGNYLFLERNPVEAYRGAEQQPSVPVNTEMEQIADCDLFKMSEGYLMYEHPGQYEGCYYNGWSGGELVFSFDMDF